MNYLTIGEKTGRFFFSKNRFWLFFIFLCTPFFISLAILIPRYVSLRETEKTFDSAALRGRLALEKRLEKETFLTRFSGSEPYFIDQYLEALPLLRNNLVTLRKMKNHPACKNRDAVAKRIAFLESSENRLSFAEENIRSTKHIKETEERLLHPVEVDGNDLSQLLSLIENVSIGDYHPNLHSPQLLIQDLFLTKKEGAIYEIQLNLIKREFIQSDEKKN